MSTDKKFYITTSIVYANAMPHIGFALELVQADALARYHRLLGDDTFFLTGTDEHGATVVRGAEKVKKQPKEFVDEVATNVQEIIKALKISNDDFIRTSDQKRHWPVAQAIWRKLYENGDLYKKNYKGLYCTGHEAFLKKSEFKDGLCPIHKTKPETIEEENWFFKLTKYRKEIESRIKNQELKIVPEHRANEVLELLKDAEDVSFSRPSKDLKWGIPVPDDPTQTMYVWADALTNYTSGIMRTNDKRQTTNDSQYATYNEIFQDEKFLKYWPADVHLVGKDILRFHALIWPAMLLSLGLKLPKAIYVHGFINVEGEKMSKTVGNVIYPLPLIEKYGVDPLRYYLLREFPSFEDGDFSHKKFEARYSGDLVNTIGNLVNRVAVLHQKFLNGHSTYQEGFVDKKLEASIRAIWLKYAQAIEEFKLHEALMHVTELAILGNKLIDEHKPWQLAKDNPEHFEQIMNTAINLILNIGWLLKPFLPETSDKILAQFSIGEDVQLWNGQPIITNEPKLLFPKLK